MPATLVVSQGEARLLHAHDIGGAEGYMLTYDPSRTTELLARLDRDDPAYQTLTERLALVASQLGIPDVMFEKPQLVGETPEFRKQMDDLAHDQEHLDETDGLHEV
jgi:hypothetical protein